MGHNVSGNVRRSSITLRDTRRKFLVVKLPSRLHVETRFQVLVTARQLVNIVTYGPQVEYSIAEAAFFFGGRGRFRNEKLQKCVCFLIQHLSVRMFTYSREPFNRFS